MKERRYTGGLPSFSQIWTGIWLVLLVFFGVLWATDALARDYGRDGDYYRGWRSDMLEEQRLQTELMERQEEREMRRERHQNYQENRGNWQRYQERMRRGVW